MGTKGSVRGFEKHGNISGVEGLPLVLVAMLKDSGLKVDKGVGLGWVSQG